MFVIFFRQYEIDRKICIAHKKSKKTGLMNLMMNLMLQSIIFQITLCTVGKLLVSYRRLHVWLSASCSQSWLAIYTTISILPGTVT